MKSSRRPYFEIANPEIPNILEGLPRGLRVLDVGCGSGVHGAELLRLHGHRVVGVDLSEASIDKAKTRLAEAYVADVTRPDRYPFHGSQLFDVILFSDMLEHLTDPLDVLMRHYAAAGARRSDPYFPAQRRHLERALWLALRASSNMATPARWIERTCASSPGAVFAGSRAKRASPSAATA